ncbi:phenylalanine--tRNA ligase subunit beta [Magnetovibrio blakemorei]|uniref:Phenylalanine--tRNA ligase beta subunit n=1 Tax=Magnetovibrio blakemorei TaxID=28181 RepID=A0A1E5Q8Q3_9PROT|nr:phenylalanine--tRNA ligase subunit beta [Magnetovibrio blakemorei]OEJ67769.1 phenylalanine--tRNA ligase subunit beta [Magnetovibrio blakemorei]
MKFTLSWLKDHLDTDATLQQVSERLTMLGLEVEGIEERSKGLEDFVVGEVLEAEKHPDADKLQILKVNNGSEILQVVCGAPNARKGLKGVFGASGMYVPGLDVTLKAATIRGVDSNGMMLSEREMGLSDAHTGIVELDESAPVGAAAVDVMGLSDPVIEIAITPNRGDCLGVRGIARDLAASGLGTLKAHGIQAIAGVFDSPIDVKLDFPEDAISACSQFVGRYVRGVKNGPSPKWMQDRLLAIGLRPISALVDITNYSTIDLGRPLHVFDADKVSGNISARLARNGETLLALDGKDYTLDDQMCVIADDQKAEGIAGVMGGEESGCTESTVNVFIESALFDPVRTAATGRKLNLMSDARYRFERGVDNDFAVDGCENATRLVMELCGGEPSKIIVAGDGPNWRKTIAFRPSRVAGLTGVQVDETEMERILTVLGFTVAKSTDSWNVEAPAWRGDMVGEACVVEEIVRVNGYHNIPHVSMERLDALPHPAINPAMRRRRTVRRTLASRGLIEAVTYSFLPSAHADLFAPVGGVPDGLRLTNPISAELDVMRPNLLPNLIAAIGRNAAHGLDDGALFEVGPQFAGDAATDQSLVAAGVRAGQAVGRNWASPARQVDAFDAKADAIAALQAAGAPTDNLQVFAAEEGGPNWYHPGRSGTLRLGPKTVLASFGEVHPGTLKKMGVKGPLVAFEVFLDNLPKLKDKKSQARPLVKLSAFHSVERDFAFVVDAGVEVAHIVRAAYGADKTLISDVQLFDVYQGQGVAEGKKSVAIQVTLQPFDKTMTDEEIEAIAQKLVSNVEKATGGELRG